MRTPAVAAALALLAACGGGSSSSESPSGCTLTYAGGASETVACDAVVRPNGSGGYVLWVTATLGSGMNVDPFVAVKLVVNSRPIVDTDYGWTASTVPASVGQSYAERSVSSTLTHEATTVGPTGALDVRFWVIPPTDGADPTGWDGIGTVHGAVDGTLVAVAGGADVTVSGRF